jgi:ArsR family transcriptional regulator, arsenate/arsenite/antimonite-responsive transcriptional repressor
MSNYRTTGFGRLAEAFKALSNPKRLELFHLLVATCCNGVCCTIDETSVSVDELAEKLGLAKSTVSHHLKELRNAGLIHVTKRGRFNEFALDGEHLETLKSFFGNCFGEIGDE